VIYSLGALSTKASLLPLLFAGRILSGLGTSLLFSAPESWLVSESMALPEEKGVDGGKELSKTFGQAYALDSLVAIAAGSLASFAESSRGVTGPFELSALALLVASFVISFSWTENVAAPSDGGSSTPSIRDALKIIKADKKIALTGAIQAFYEAAMYIFVLQWPPAVAKGIEAYFGVGAAVP